MHRPGTSDRIPFDLLVGSWVGTGVVFYPDGSYHSHIPSRVVVEELMSGGQRYLRYNNFSGEGESLRTHIDRAPPRDLHDLFAGVATSLCRSHYHLLFRVEGKTMVATEKSPSIASAVGSMSSNDQYSFIVRDTYQPTSGPPIVLTLHNNHYFPSSNTRHVIGTIADPDGRTIMLTSFTYMAYTEPNGR